MKKYLRKLGARAGDSILSFIRNRSGVAMLEFAMMAPVLLLLAAGSFEVARYALILQKLDRIVGTLSDLVTRSGSATMTEMEISNILDSALYMAQPFDISGDSMMVLTSVVGRAGQAPVILSQRVQGSVAGGQSAVGTVVDEDATLPPAFPDAGSGETLSDGENLIVAEIIYNYKPYLTGELTIFEDMVFYRDSYFRPRYTATILFPSAP